MTSTLRGREVGCPKRDEKTIVLIGCVNGTVTGEEGVPKNEVLRDALMFSFPRTRIRTMTRPMKGRRRERTRRRRRKRRGQRKKTRRKRRRSSHQPPHQRKIPV